MNGTKRSIEELVAALNQGSVPAGLDIVVAPTALHLQLVMSSIKGDKYQVAAQNASQFADGAFTGDVSATQIKDFGINWVILGHSERRKTFGETDKMIGDKVSLALKAGLSVIACVGETLDDRKANQTMAVVIRQLEAIGANVSDWSKVVIAYEPVWAIGTGVTATPTQAQEVHANIREWLKKYKNEQISATTRIIYGGSVKADTCETLFAQADVDGFLVGGASLIAKEFLAICNRKSK